MMSTKDRGTRKVLLQESSRWRVPAWFTGPLMISVGLALLIFTWHPSGPVSTRNAAVMLATSTSTATPTSIESPPPSTSQPFGADLASAALAAAGTPVVVTASVGSAPVQLDIDSVGIHQKIVEVTSHVRSFSGQAVREWDVADYAVGHHDSSADPGEGGNIVLAGHDDWHGEVFRDLHNVKKGDEIVVITADGETHRYRVSDILLPRIVGLSINEQIEIGKLIEPTAGERLTLVTCWPYGVDDHRLIVIAQPEE